MKLIYIILLIALIFFAFRMFKRQKPKCDRYCRWKIKYGMRYGVREDSYRRAIFKRNVRKIRRINRRQRKYRAGINQFTAMTKKEFAAIYLTLIVGGDKRPAALNVKPLGDIDWRTKGAVSDVKNQKSCGSCWAFSAVGNLEAVHYIYEGGSMVTFSEQQLVDCSRSYGNYGCNGGWMDYAFHYVYDKGITTDKDYPYVGVDQKCKVDGGSYKVCKGKWKDVPKGDCTSQKGYIDKNPISVAVDASNWSSYRGGIFSNCGSSLNHGVTAVGYTGEYWIVKNSWGKSWGEQGYIRVKMGNTCGICNASSSCYV